MTLRLHPQAEEDLAKALKYYFEINEALEINFLKYLESTFDKILRFSQMYPFENNFVQKVVLEKFPYIVLYERYEDIIMILAIFHTKRDPQILQDRE